jgi:hypothetical protein
MNKVSNEQWSFFKQLSKIAFSNPFGCEREQLECHLLGIETGKNTAQDREDQIQQKTRQYLQQLQQGGVFHCQQFNEPIREIVKIAWLFYTYHDQQQSFDLLINKQSESGDIPIEFKSARQLIIRFEQAGFTQDETAKFIALFYQLRRGFNFISQSISGESPSIIELRMRLWNNIFTHNPEWYLKFLCGKMEDFSTLLLGETGTGKSLVAHAIGCSGFIPFEMESRRFKASFTSSFQAINLSQYSSGLLESELFGHKKGAFTGAVENHQGLFARCSQFGAVFIDEIGDIDIPTQVKLLTVIQDREFSAVGSHEKLRFEGRVIAATNQEIHQLRSEGRFRNDLYYRLCSDVIRMPNLRQRLDEDPHELRILIAKLLDKVLIRSDELLLDRLENRIRDTVPDDYAWPGNVRELEQCIRRICLTGAYQVENKNIPAMDMAFSEQLNAGSFSAQQLLQVYCRRLYQHLDSYEAVARKLKLDRRTVRKYIVEEEGSL